MKAVQRARVRERQRGKMPTCNVLFEAFVVNQTMLNKGVSLPSFTVCKGREKGGVDNLRRCVQMPVVRACWGVTRVRVLKLMQVDLN